MVAASNLMKHNNDLLYNDLLNKTLCHVVKDSVYDITFVRSQQMTDFFLGHISVFISISGS